MAQAQYITIAELNTFYDTRALAQLGSDTGTPLASVTGDAQGIIANAIEAASSAIESHALRGKRYSLVRLAALDTADDWTLKSMTGALAMGHLYERRGGVLPDAIATAVKAANQFLEDLNNGRQIFPDDTDAQDAGLAGSKIEATQVRRELGLVSDSEFFPRRQSRIV